LTWKQGWKNAELSQGAATRCSAHVQQAYRHVRQADWSVVTMHAGVATGGKGMWVKATQQGAGTLPQNMCVLV